MQRQKIDSAHDTFRISASAWLDLRELVVYLGEIASQVCREHRFARSRANRIGRGFYRSIKYSNGLSTTGMASRVEDVVHSGAEAGAVLLDEAAPTAFVCASDTLAMGVLHTLWIRQLAPGRDIGVVGFDDSQ